MLPPCPRSKRSRDAAGSCGATALWWIALAVGLLLRLWFLQHPMPSDDDTVSTRTWRRISFIMESTELQTTDPSIRTLIRLPGYPLFLGLIFSLFGAGNFKAVLLAQIGFDLLGCWLIASFVREQVSERAGTVAIFLAALCPFTAAYSAIALTECLSVFAVSLALWATGRVLRAQAEEHTRSSARLCSLSLPIAMAMLLRPDGVLLAAAVMAAIGWYAWRQGRLAVGFKTALLCGLLAALPLVALDSAQLADVSRGSAAGAAARERSGRVCNLRLLSLDGLPGRSILCRRETFSGMLGRSDIDVDDLPSRAFDSPVQRAQTTELLAKYNTNHTVTPELDAEFAALAEERERAHPLLCRVWVPALRVADMLLRPRTETLGLDADWWRFSHHRVESVEAVGLGLLNAALVGAALVGVARRRVPWVALMLVYAALRCALLSTMENSEPRYTLELLPILMVCAACGVAGTRVGPAKPISAGAIGAVESPAEPERRPEPVGPGGI